MQHHITKDSSRFFLIMVVLALVTLGLAFPAGAFGQAQPPAPETAAPAAAGDVNTGGSALQPAPKLPVVSYHSKTGKVRFMAAQPGMALAQAPASLDMQSAGAPESAARFFLSQYGGQFGLQDPSGELRLERSTLQDDGRNAVRFQQVYQGVPVFGGELIVRVDALGQTQAAMGEILPDLNLETQPSVSPDSAAETARQITAKDHGFDLSAAAASTPELWIYDPSLVGAPALPKGVALQGGAAGSSRLAWRTEVTAAERLDVRELVLIDAQSGAALLHFNQVDSALSRKVYDKFNVPGSDLPGTLRRSEGEAAIGFLDVDNAYDYAGATYHFYQNYHGRDSIDNAGMELIQTVRYCPASGSCPYGNAFWNGSQMVYGDGYASGDDVVAHELTHGVTEHESNLFYYMQSGAINEALSDIWGEWIDLTYTNGQDDDTPGVRWLIGEDLPIGAIRSMSNPPSYLDPDSTSSSNYYCSTGDNGGVHYNSGVVNKAAFLITDGGFFNGYTIAGLGITKATRIFYAAQTGMLTSGADFQDLNDSLAYACTNLIGQYGITTDSCDNVRKALAAVGMDKQPPFCSVADAPVCNVPDFSSTFNSSLSGWTVVSGSWPTTASALTTGGTPGGYVSIAHPTAYRDFRFEAVLNRAGCNSCENALIARGVPTLASGGRWTSGYLFAVNGLGQYRVTRWDAGSSTIVQAWKTHPVIFTGAAYNTLAVESQAGRLNFFVNDTLVWTGTDYDLNGTQVGIAMYRDGVSGGNLLSVDSANLAGGTPAYLLNETFESSLASWTQVDGKGTGDAWTLDNWGYATSGLKSVFGSNASYVADFSLGMTSGVAIPAGKPVYLRFNHYYGLETDYDGGVVEYSSNGGAWTDAGPLFVDRGYTGTLSSSFENPLGGRMAFTGLLNGYSSSRLTLVPLAGNTVRFRFRLGSDVGVYVDGWLLDDVQIYTCTAQSTHYVMLPFVKR